MGPFPVDKDGNQHVLVVVDGFTRFIELYKTKDTTAVSAAEALLTHMGRYGTPNEIFSDRGTQFRNELISKLQELLETTHNFTAPNSHEENAIVERANKEVNRHLRSIIFHKKIVADWSICLPLVQRIMNSQVHSATQVSPAQLLFGNAVNLERRMFIDNTIPGRRKEDEPVTSIGEYMDKLLALQAKVLSIAKDNQYQLDSHHIQLRKKGPKTEFPINSYVLYADPTGLTVSGKTRLNTPLQGPFRVVSRVPTAHQADPEGGDIYVIENLISHVKRDVNVNHLRPFEYNLEMIDPTEVAMTDNEEFPIEEIVGHLPKLKAKDFIKLRKTQMKFLVKYTGYEQVEENTWENLKKTDQLHAYLRKHKMQTLIPASYRLNTLIRMRADQVQ
jgi:hypothetical protein